VRPPFATKPGPGQTSVWDFPRPPRLAPEARELRVVWGEVTVATSTRALRVLETGHPPTYYVPFAQYPVGDMVLLLRGPGDPSPLAAAGRHLVLRRDAGQPVYEVRSLRRVRSDGAVGLQFAATFMGVFGLVGLLLAGVGIYAIMAYAVRQRTHEIGVRLALGARPREVLSTTLGRGLRLTAIGLVVGLAGAYGLGSLMERTLFGSIKVDALTFVVA